MTFRPRPDHPYAHAPRIPDGENVPITSLVPGDGPIEIEVGPGRGGFLFDRAKVRPDVRLIGFEIRLKWAAIVDERLRKAGLGARARVFNADAKEALRRLSPEATVSAFFIHFPDPWWKKRHTKRLVVSDGLLQEMVRLLVDHGDIFVQTDVRERFDLYAEALAAEPILVPAGDVEGSADLSENPYGARSPRELHAIADGLPVHRMRYRRRPRAS